MKNDINLVKKISNLKIPLWISFFPVIGNLVFSSIYKSWMFDFNDINTFWKKHRSMVIRTSGAWVISLIFYLLFTAIYWIVILYNDYTSDFFTPFFVAISFFILLFNIIYQPINLYYEPKKMLKEYGLDNLKTIQTNFADSLFVNYDFNECLSNFKNNLFKLSSFCLFSNSEEIKNKWIANIQNLSNYNIAKNNIICREFNLNRSNNTWSSSSCPSHFKYLFSTGIWYLGTFFLIHSLFDKNNTKLTNKIKLIGSLFTCFFWLINIFVFIAFFVIYFFTNTDQILFYFSPFIFIVINLFYINFIGLMISLCVKNQL